ncbi:MAG: precorrin-6x reductase, partial [Frankiales bacterium]|nr:precorrin-6x reductase [Frankiales bacterium]
MRVLILGGTGEARALALALADRPATSFESSLAGRVSNPALPVGQVRIGGFGGIAGLAEHLQAGGFDLVVDATHPFAATITEHAVAASRLARRPLLVLRRPGWSATAGDDWTWVSDIEAAAAAIAAAPPGTVLLTTGRRDLSVFAADAGHHYVVRTVDPPAGPMPERMTLLLDRGPYTVEGELALMRTHDVRCLVTKD